MAYRLDSHPIGKAERTPQGGLRVSAFVTRTGVFEYRRADGSIQRELRRPEQVFHADSLQTLEDAVLTDLHPGKVTPKDYKKVAIGHVRNPSQEDKFVKATVIVQDAAAITAVENKSRKELSCGYTCDMVMGSGEYEGEKYDAEQINIRYNHVAIGPANWGRAGSAVALHLDSAGDMYLQDEGRTTMEFETIDGISFKVGSPEHIQALRKGRQDAVARADSAEASAKVEKSRADKAEGERDSLKKTHEDSAKGADAALDAAVNDRIAIHTKARKVLGAEAKFDGKSDRQVMIEAIQKTDASFKATDDTATDYIRGRFEGVSAPRQDSISRVKADANAAIKSGVKAPPAEGKKSPEQIRKDNRTAAHNAWTLPLTVSKK